MKFFKKREIYVLLCSNDLSRWGLHIYENIS